ncbi:cell division topological specificity factor MinE [Phaeospirillum tilakii]|uniref:Cell division topological specificity factor n=1 Tax=Phaeospirillum tilakii TaxID=741673 RepID=A0ABW5CBG0_9PROT
MSVLGLFTRRPKRTAEAARERLQILLAHERAGLSGADFLPQLQRELIEVIRKYVSVEEDRVQVRLEREQHLSVLEVNIELPAPGDARRA